MRKENRFASIRMLGFLAVSLLLLSAMGPAAMAQLQFSGPTNYPVGNSPSGIAVGDFNGDGKKDLAVVNTADQTVSILLGNGDGTFQPAVNYPCGGTCSFVAVGDFRGDGRLDLVLSNGSANTVSILLGNGDGTFQAGVQYSTGASADYVSVADFNNDKKADLLVSTAGSSISILLGNGDGTFQAPVITSSIGSFTRFFAVGDFNGDGKLDVATGNSAGGNPSTGNLIILLGNGDGTFQVPLTSSLSFEPEFFATGDFNGDGKLDMAVVGISIDKACIPLCVSTTTGFVSALLGNGDGTFALSFTVPFTKWNTETGGNTPQGLAVADLDNDGKLDLALLSQPVGPNACDNVGGIVTGLGNGDGTFQQGNSVPMTGAFSFALGDVDGDTLPDVIAGNPPFCNQPPPPNTVSIFLNTTPSFALSLTLAGNGGGTITSQPAVLNCSASCSGEFAPGTTVTLTAVPNATSIFSGWGGACSGTAATCTVNMSADQSVTATFTALFPLSVSLAGSGSGTVISSPAGINCGSTCSATFVSGTTVTLTAAPNATSNFTGWSGACSGTSACSVTTSAAASVIATFTLQDFTLRPASTNLTVPRGTQGTDAISIVPQGGPFTSAIQLSCAVTGPAPLPTCALSATSVTPGANSATSTLTITAPALSAALLPSADGSFSGSLYAVFLPFPGLTLLGFGLASGKSKNRRRILWLLAGLTLALVTLQVGCSGGGSQTQPLNYSVTVTATSGAIQHTAQVTVTVP